MAVESVKADALEYLVAEGISVPHGFTTRLGGVSAGYLAALNLGIHRGDDPKNVVKNYEILGSTLGFDVDHVVLSHQTHTDIVLAVDESHRGAGLFGPELPECDGLITNTPGVALAIFTADCTPILLHDPVTGAVGAVHAGWRGTAAGIAGKAVLAMCDHYGCAPGNIQAAIGPHIGQCCFETGPEVPQAMLAALGEAAQPFIAPEGDKFYVDLTGMNTLFLQRAGVKQIQFTTECTKCAPDRFWSARVHGDRRGSQGAIIVR